MANQFCGFRGPSEHPPAWNGDWDGPDITNLSGSKSAWIGKSRVRLKGSVYSRPGASPAKKANRRSTTGSSKLPGRSLARSAGAPTAPTKFNLPVRCSSSLARTMSDSNFRAVRTSQISISWLYQTLVSILSVKNSWERVPLRSKSTPALHRCWLNLIRSLFTSRLSISW